MEKFSDIKTRNDFADFLNFSRRKLTYILYVKGTDSYYTTFTIPKKSGENRTMPNLDIRTQLMNGALSPKQP